MNRFFSLFVFVNCSANPRHLTSEHAYTFRTCDFESTSESCRLISSFFSAVAADLAAFLHSLMVYHDFPCLFCCSPVTAGELNVAPTRDKKKKKLCKKKNHFYSKGNKNNMLLAI